MKILLITQWYKPIKGAVKRMARIANHFSENNEMTILTGLPSYPTGILPKEYHWKLWVNEKDGRAKVLRTYEYPSLNKGVLKRLLNNFSFMISSCIGALILPKQDIVIVTSPSFLSGIPALLARSLGAKMIFDIRDLWPDSAIELGYLKGNLMIRTFKFLEKLYYKKATIITTATPSIREHLFQEGLPPEKVKLLLNSTDTDFFRPAKTDRRKYGFKADDFVLTYTGAHGPAQGLEAFVKTAANLKKYPKIKFFFVGEGEEKEKLIALAKKLNLRNILFHNEVPITEIVKMVNFSDIGLIGLAREKIFQQAMPTKASEYFACGKPVIATVGGTLKEYLHRYQTGFAVAHNPKEIAEKILKIYQNPALKQKMGKDARKLALEVFSDKKFYQTLDKIIK